MTLSEYAMESPDEINGVVPDDEDEDIEAPESEPELEPEPENIADDTEVED